MRNVEGHTAALWVRTVVFLLLAAVARGEEGLKVDGDFPGGNILIDKIEGDEASVHQDLRDTQGHWFYWNFRVRGAAGRKLTFKFTQGEVIGVRGPAISTDGGKSWSWLGNDAVKGNTFTYQFAADAGEVRFCVTIPYLESNLKQFIARHVANPAMKVSTLCKSKKGRDVELLHLGRPTDEAKFRVALTCRHHACETLASYTLEGIMEAILADDELGRWFRENTAFFVVPLVDKDGVEEGDQGKNRKPHDHNRDYNGQSIYPEVAAIRRQLPAWSKDQLDVALDMHCPTLRGKYNEEIYFVGSPDPTMWGRVTVFSKLLEEHRSGPLVYHASDNIPYGVGWNTDQNYGQGLSFFRWAGSLPGVNLATTIEIPYANVSGKEATAQSARALGRDLAVALRLYLQRVGTGAETRGNAGPVSVSGRYPHLAMFNGGGECGIGAVVPWADRLWVITYPPHMPQGSDDKLYEIDAELNSIVRGESVGGTHANRMIHRESNQLLIGPYVIDAQRNVRVIAPKQMPGRLTGTARHLTDPSNKVYYATMEEGFYEVDVRSLAVKELYSDANGTKNPVGALLPGYHGKGLYAGQGRLIYANNGEYTKESLARPDIASGCLAQWDGKDWRVVRRNQFTEVTGPGGIRGNDHPDTDPLWSIGWDHRSLILMLLDGGQWHTYRLPKASHCYDGAHGWNTEWPRIRDIGQRDLLMTMHGMFWRFPKTFSRARSAGIAPRSTYLKVIGDFGRWNDRLVFGCDDTAQNEFLNIHSKARGDLAGPGQSQSNLWFAEPEHMDGLGIPLGRGAVWLDDSVKADEPSDAYLFSGFENRSVHLSHDSEAPVTFSFEVDRDGDGRWTLLREVEVPVHGYRWVEFGSRDKGVWVRLRVNRDCAKATAYFHSSNADRCGNDADPLFDGLAKPDGKSASGGLVHAKGNNSRTLHFAAMRAEEGTARDAGYYEMGADLTLRRVENPQAHQWLKQNAAIPHGVLAVDESSVLYVDDRGRRWRLPRSDAAFDQPNLLGDERIEREVSTERNLFNCHGTFYELPAENAGGFVKIRPIATHNRRIKDYCSYRGLLVLSGLADEAPAKSPHVIRSEDGRCSLWVGDVDDLWKLGKPRGRGGPWKNTAVKAGEPSDPYLMTGYDRKSLRLGHSGKTVIQVRVEVDISGTGQWRTCQTIDVPPGKAVEHRFPDAFQAYWVRVVAGSDGRATAEFLYE